MAEIKSARERNRRLNMLSQEMRMAVLTLRKQGSQPQDREGLEGWAQCGEEVIASGQAQAPKRAAAAPAGAIC